MLSRLVPGVVAAAVVVSLAFASGGYFPSEHGLLALAFALTGLAAVLAAERVAIDRRGVALVGGLAGLSVWTLVSVAWAPTATWPVLEAERGLVYAVAAATLLLTLTVARVRSLLAGTAVGIVVVALYALATRLAPGSVGGAYDPSAGYQLAEPIGYWNALGALLALGTVLAAGFARHGAALRRVVAGASLVPFATALFFTFSRGALVALAVAAVALVALERERWRAVAGLAAVALAPALAVLLASRSHALTAPGATLETAQAEGRSLAWQLVLVAALGAFVTAGLIAVERCVRVPVAVRRTAAAALAAAVGAAVVVGVVGVGGPGDVLRRGTDAFRQQPPPTDGDLHRRLLSVSGHGRADYWRVAWRMVQREPLLGEGGGGFERRWLAERPVASDARDAHNLYLETLAELGPGGLAVLLVALAAPLTALRRASATALGPAAGAAYVGFLVHAALDWDWEVPLLVLVALACAAALLALGRSGLGSRLTLRRRGAAVAALTAVAAVSVVAHLGNRAVAESADALVRGDLVQAADAARRAARWAPWSHEPLQLEGEALLAAGRDDVARRRLRRAARRAPEEWSVWYDLGLVERVAARRAAITQARGLNPLGYVVINGDGR